MNKVIYQFENFYQNYYSKMNVYEKRLANLIMNNFDEIEKLGTGRGQRGRKIALLINENKSNIILTKTISETNKQVINSDFRLDRMEIEEFRGFSNKEKLDLSKDFTFVYGPNGTGKSCFCEALEYSLLGSIEEAVAKRIPVQQYVKNVFTNSAKKPLVYVKSGNEIKPIEPNPELFSFCFIEKNRIENFSRIATDSPTGQQQKLSALFGLDEWNNFVKNFNSELITYLPSTNKNISSFKTMNEKMIQEDIFRKDVDSNKNKIIEEAKLITSKYENIKSMKEFMEHVDGNNDNIGKIAHLEKQIKENENFKKIDMKFLINLKDMLSQLIDINVTISNEKNELSKFKEKMSLKEFYQQILNSKIDNKCPACLSDLYSLEGNLLVPEDPYKKAYNYLEEIQKAIDLEKNIQKNESLLSKNLFSIKSLSTQVSTDIVPLNKKEDIFTGFFKTIDGLITKEKQFSQSDFNSFIEAIKSLEKEINDYNEKVLTVTKENETLQKKLKSILEDKSNLLEIKGKFQLLDTQDKKIKEQLETSRKNLKAQHFLAELEQNENNINEQYCENYKNLLQKLIEYSNELPLKLIESLEEKVLEIYNEINKNDFEGDKLHSIILPKTSNEKILISFMDKPDLKMDALLVLSEGHVKCLGLSLLLSKIITDNLPLIVFDDVVNAIDDEHKNAIAELITSHEDISTRQCIVTTHGSNYMETLENRIPQKLLMSKATRVIFAKPIEQGKINVLSDASTRHLLDIALKNFHNNDFSNCLTFCRKSVEKLSDEAWRLYYKFSNLPIEIKLKGKKDYPESNNIFTKLIKEFKKLKIEPFNNLISIMESIMDFDKKNNILWNSMNAGTHHSEREYEFDETSIKELLDLLIAADEEINCNIKISNRGILSYKDVLQEYNN